MNWFHHLVNGNLAAARMVKDGVSKGDTVVLDSHTAPTPSGKHILQTRITEVLSNGWFIVADSEPYFGYTRFHINDIIA